MTDALAATAAAGFATKADLLVISDLIAFHCSRFTFSLQKRLRTTNGPASLLSRLQVCSLFPVPSRQLKATDQYGPLPHYISLCQFGKRSGTVIRQGTPRANLLSSLCIALHAALNAQCYARVRESRPVFCTKKRARSCCQNSGTANILIQF